MENEQEISTSGKEEDRRTRERAPLLNAFLRSKKTAVERKLRRLIFVKSLPSSQLSATMRVHRSLLSMVLSTSVPLLRLSAPLRDFSRILFFRFSVSPKRARSHCAEAKYVAPVRKGTYRFDN